MDCLAPVAALAGLKTGAGLGGCAPPAQTGPPFRVTVRRPPGFEAPGIHVIRINIGYALLALGALGFVAWVMGLLHGWILWAGRKRRPRSARRPPNAGPRHAVAPEPTDLDAATEFLPRIPRQVR